MEFCRHLLFLYSCHIDDLEVQEAHCCMAVHLQQSPSLSSVRCLSRCHSKMNRLLQEEKHLTVTIPTYLQKNRGNLAAENFEMNRRDFQPDKFVCTTNDVTRPSLLSHNFYKNEPTSNEQKNMNRPELKIQTFDKMFHIYLSF